MSEWPPFADINRTGYAFWSPRHWFRAKNTDRLAQYMLTDAARAWHYFTVWFERYCGGKIVEREHSA